MKAQLDEVLSTLLDTAPQDREAALLHLTLGDEALRDEARRWLAMLPEAEEFFSPIERFSTSNAGDLSGQRIGAYKIVSPIAAGGMGRVYLAERADGEFRANVAIKFVSPLFAGPGFKSRFQIEKQALAALRHPNIAQLLDAGIAPDGAPYLVMEYVEGLPIDAYCQSRALTIPARIRLFLNVCSAVTFAHQNLILHRDIKPANVLVNAEGLPKLLDFGIAKILAPGAIQATLPQDRALTPAYSSPEVIRGEPASTAADAYSLGVLLYELLAGRPVYPPGEHLTALMRRVCEWDPPPPSATADPSLRRHLLGDLDNIVAKAIHKDPALRYPTPAALAADLENFLARRPVAARAPTLLYRLRKFVRRNAVLVAAAAAIFSIASFATHSVLRHAAIAESERAAALAARDLAQQQQAAAESARQLAEEHRQSALREQAAAVSARHLAESRFAEVRSLANSVLFEYQNQLAVAGGNTQLRAKMAGDSIRYLDRLAAQSAADHELLLEVARGYIAVAGLQGAPNQPNLGDRAGAAASYEKARTLLDRILNSNPKNVPAQRARAAVLCNLLEFNQNTWTPCTSAWHSLHAQNPSESWAAAGLAAAYTRVFSNRSFSHQQKLADSAKAIALLETLHARSPENLEYARNLALNHKSRSGVFQLLEDQLSLRAEINKAIHYDQLRLKRFPDSPGILLDLSFDHSMMATHYEAIGEPAKALAEFQNVLAIRRGLLDRDRENVWLQDRTLYTFTSVAVVQLRKLNDPAAARATYNEGLALAATLKPRPDHGEWNRILWRLHVGLALSLSALNEPPSQLCPHATLALAHRAKAANVDSHDSQLERELRAASIACPANP